MATQPTITALVDSRYSDVVLFEEFLGGLVPYSRDVVTVNYASAATLKLGHLLFRAKGSSATVKWDVVDAAADINVANEYAVLIGGDADVADTVTLGAGVDATCIAITRKAMIKDAAVRAMLKASPYSLTDANVNDLFRLLASQGVLVGASLTAIVP